MSPTDTQLLGVVSSHTGIRTSTGLAPLSGPDTRVFPPTDGVDEHAPITRYAKMRSGHFVRAFLDMVRIWFRMRGLRR